MVQRRSHWAVVAVAALLIAGCATTYDRQGANRDDNSPAADAPSAAKPSHNSTQ
jgi:outer membrane biogenesis lipoprotein LolB